MKRFLIVTLLAQTLALGVGAARAEFAAPVWAPPAAETGAFIKIGTRCYGPRGVRVLCP